MEYIGLDYHKQYTFASRIKENGRIAAYYDRIKRRKSVRAVRVATARRLLTIAYPHIFLSGCHENRQR